MDVLNDLPASIEWCVYRGDTANFSMFVRDEDDNPIDMTGYDVTGQIRQNPSDANPEQTLAIVVNNDLIDITIPDTSILKKVSYFDINTAKDGVTKTLLFGRIMADQDVTR